MNEGQQIELTVRGWSAASEEEEECTYSIYRFECLLDGRVHVCISDVEQRRRVAFSEQTQSQPLQPIDHAYQRIDRWMDN